VELSGLEAELLMRPISDLTFNVSVSTLNLNIVSLANGNALLENCTNPAQPTFATCQAQDIGRAPELQYTLGAQYDLKLPADALLTLSGTTDTSLSRKVAARRPTRPVEFVWPSQPACN
jgi:hypothetical protein